MYFADYHIHSHYSPDSEARLEDICEAAIRAGLHEICLTDHHDVNGFAGKPYDFRLPERHREYEAVRDRFAGRLSFKYGSELGQALEDPALAETVYAEKNLDFIIGSMHNSPGEPDFYCMEYPDRETCVAALGRYYRHLLDMACRADFDVLGHIGYPLRYMPFELDPMDFEEEISAVFRALIERGKGIELNIGDLRRGKKATPTLAELKLYRSLGGEIITVGTDAHLPEEVGQKLKLGYLLLWEAGFERIATFDRRRPELMRIV